MAKRINQVSAKQSEINKRIKVAYEIMDEDVENRYCKGCGVGSSLTHSHIISRKGHELCDDLDNIEFLCMKCHCKWESVGLRMELMSYIDSMKYIKSVRSEIWKKNIVDDYEWLVNNDADVIVENEFYVKREFKKM